MEAIPLALRIIGAGLGRTGTLSLKLALEQLGFGPCYHMLEVFREPAKRVPHWERVSLGEAVDWDEVFAGFQATVDWPACNYYRELMVRYPDARVILSVRDAASWFASTQATILDDVPAAGRPPFIRRVVDAVIGEDWHDRDRLMAAFERHNAAVRTHVPAHRLLEFRASDGWAPLCAFLGVPVPATPYPRVNSTEEFRSRFARPAT
jgi:hypothetical protein